MQLMYRPYENGVVATTSGSIATVIMYPRFTTHANPVAVPWVVESLRSETNTTWEF